MTAYKALKHYWDPVYTIHAVVKTGCQTCFTTVLNEQPLFVQPVVKPGFTTGWTNSHCWFNRLSNRIVQPVWQPAVYTIQPLSNRLSNGFDNPLNVCIHDTTGCQTGLTTGCFVWTGLDAVPNNSHRILYKFNWHDWHKLPHLFYLYICMTSTFSHSSTPSSFIFVSIAEWLQNRQDSRCWVKTFV